MQSQVWWKTSSYIYYITVFLYARENLSVATAVSEGCREPTQHGVLYSWRIVALQCALYCDGLSVPHVLTDRTTCPGRNSSAAIFLTIPVAIASIMVYCEQKWALLFFSLYAKRYSAGFFLSPLNAIPLVSQISHSNKRYSDISQLANQIASPLPFFNSSTSGIAFSGT
jgi:hypothetical protein